MWDAKIVESEDKKKRSLKLAKNDKLLAEMCAKIVQMATQATQQQLQSALYLPCRVADDDLLVLMGSVGIEVQEIKILADSRHFRDFKTRGFVLGPVSHACNIFLGDHLDRWVNGHQPT